MTFFLYFIPVSHSFFILSQEVHTGGVMSNMSATVCTQIDVHLVVNCPATTSEQSSEIDKQLLSPHSHDILTGSLTNCTVAAQHVSISSRFQHDATESATYNKEHDTYQTEIDNANNFVVSDVFSTDEWNTIDTDLEKGFEFLVYSVCNNICENEVEIEHNAPSIIDNDKDVCKFSVDPISDLQIVTVIMFPDLTVDHSTAEPCLTKNENEPGVEHFKLVLAENLIDRVHIDNEVSENRSNCRKRRNVGRTRYGRRKWKIVSPSDDSISNFDFSLFPYRAENLTTDMEESKYIDAELIKLEASVGKKDDEATAVTMLDSKSIRLNSPKSLIQIVRDHIDGSVSIQSCREMQVSVPGVCQTQIDDRAKSKIGDKLGKKQQSKIRSELTQYYSDMHHNELATYEDRLCQCHLSHSLSLDRLFDMQDRGAVVRLRQTKKWRIEKAHVQVKTKYCRSVCNTAHGCTYYAHHRITKLMVICLVTRRYYASEQLSTRRIDKAKGRTMENIQEYKVNQAREVPVKRGPRVTRPPPAVPVPCYRYAIDCNNADAALSTDLISLLITMQDRDLSPEDYELLLRLDERVAPKTISAAQLQGLRTDVVGKEAADMENCLREEVCTICMELYELGQVRKYLPCGHGFHDGCIDSWLTNASINCPLDGQEVQL